MNRILRILVPILILAGLACAGVAEDRAADSAAVWAIKVANPSSTIAWVSSDAYDTWSGVRVDGATGRVTHLYLYSRQLTIVPAEIGKLTALTSLYLTSDELTSVPAEIGQLTALTSLNLSSKALTTVPSEIGQLTALTSLDLSSNALTTVPSEIGQLTALTSLDLSSNALKTVPAEIGKLAALEYLSLVSNAIASLPAELGDLNALTELYLRGNELTSVPAEIGKLTSLTSLDVSSNELTSVPAEIGDLTSLMKLQLDDNALTSLPAEIGKLTSLTELNVSYNVLTSVPAEIGDLASLITLDLSFNELASLPSEIGKLSALTTLHLNSNLLTVLPDPLFKTQTLTALHEYFVSWNYLSSADTTTLQSTYTSATTFPQYPRIKVTLQNPVAADKDYDGTPNTTITGTLDGITTGHAIDYVCKGFFSTADVGLNIDVNTTSSMCYLAGTHADIYSLTLPGTLKADIYGFPAEKTPEGMLENRSNMPVQNWSEAVTGETGLLTLNDLQGRHLWSTTLPSSAQEVHTHLGATHRVGILQINQTRWLVK